MKARALSNAQMRAADEYTVVKLGVPSEVLMRRAGLALADEVEAATKKLKAGKVLVVCGTGNNGGDGYVCAQELINRGICAEVYAAEGELSIDCAREKERYKGGYSRHICGAIIVDCLFGTGLSRKVTGVFSEIIEKINSTSAYVISADIPSGLSGDNGLVLGNAVKADKTVAIAEYKTGMFLSYGLDYCGEIALKDIGITCPPANYAQVNYGEGSQRFYNKRKRNTHKGDYGSANIIAGSEKYCGASVLALEAALRSGCGYVKFTSDEKLKYALVAKFPQVIYTNSPDLDCNAVAIGMGGGVSGQLYAEIKFLLENYCGKLIIDADGLNSLARYGADILKRKKCQVVITPHVKEFSRLTGISVGSILENPVSVARKFAAEYGVTVLLKSCASIITDGVNVAINVRGTTALAKGGSGDMLAGFLCGCLAQGMDCFSGAYCAAQTLGLAAEIASKDFTDYCVTAKEIINNLRFSVSRLTD